MKAKNQNYRIISILVLLALISPISYAGDITAESGKAEIANNNEVFLSLKNIEPNGKDWRLVSAGSAGGIGVGKYSIYDTSAGLSRLTIDTSGNVGIGTTGPTDKLHVEATGDSNIRIKGIGASGRAQIILDSPGGTWQIEDTTSGGAGNHPAGALGFTESGVGARVTFLKGGNVGIGTTNPGVKLDVQMSSGELIRAYSTGVDSNSVITIKNDAREWQLRVMGDDSDKFNIRDTTANAVRLAIDSSGNVGIGTTDPGGGQLNPGTGTRLHLYQNSASNPTTLAIVNEIGTTNAGNLINFFNEGGGGDARIAYTLGGTGLDWVMGVDNSDSDKFKISGGANDNTIDVGTNARLTIDSSGNVGIGTTGPAENLHVYGTEQDVDIRLQNTQTSGRHYAFRAKDDGIFRFVDITAGRIIWSADSAGNVGIGTTSPSYKLHVAGDVGASAFYYTSDATLKNNISKVSGLNIVNQLNGVSFNWKATGEKGAGLIAQDVEKIFPLAVSADSNGIKSLNYGALTAPIVESIKEMHQKNLEQEKKIAQLENEIFNLKMEINQNER